MIYKNTIITLMTIFSLMSVGWGQSERDNLSLEMINISDEDVMIIFKHEIEGYIFSDTSYISVSRLLPPCDDGYTDIDGECYYQSDLDVLQEFIDNSLETINMNMDVDNNGVIEPLELCSQEVEGTGLVYQTWGNGRLNSLYCQNVGLNGEISESIGNLTNLEVLGINYNPISGTIPESIGELDNLWLLTLYNNDLNGSIPESIWNMSNIEKIYLGYNNITGSISSSIENLIYLEELYLSSNQISGTIPEVICNLTNLQNTWFGGNKFCPPYPDCGSGPITSENSQNTSECVECSVVPSDLNNDLTLNVMDVILMVGCVLSESCDECSDFNEDGSTDILDIVDLVNVILGQE